MADDQMSSSEMRQRMSWGAGIAIGMGVGVAMGSALENMALGIAIGVAIGVAFAIVIGAAGRRKPRRGDAPDGPDAGGPDLEEGDPDGRDSDDDGSVR